MSSTGTAARRIPDRRRARRHLPTANQGEKPTMTTDHKRIKVGSLLAAAVLVISACGSDDNNDAGSDSTTAATTASTTATTSATTEATTATAESTASSDSTATSAGGGSDDGVTAEGISDARCAENKAAGKITYISSFDFSASASIVDVLVAKQEGYFDKMCLDVDIKPGFSTSNYPLVAAGTGNFSSAGNYTEILNNTGAGAEFVALVDYGKAPIEALVTPAGGATSLDQLKGKTIGVKGDLPPSLVAMLAKAGLARGTDYKELLLDGFDP